MENVPVVQLPSFHFRKGTSLISLCPLLLDKKWHLDYLLTLYRQYSVDTRYSVDTYVYKYDRICMCMCACVSCHTCIGIKENIENSDYLLRHMHVCVCIYIYECVCACVYVLYMNTRNYIYMSYIYMCVCACNTYIINMYDVWHAF